MESWIRRHAGEVATFPVMGTLSPASAFFGSATVFSKRRYGKCLIAFVCTIGLTSRVSEGRGNGQIRTRCPKSMKSAPQEKRDGQEKAAKAEG
jgi:hypothetical protein